MRCLPVTRAEHPIIAVTLGDPGGIGPEVTVKALARLEKEPVFRQAGWLLLGPEKFYREWARRIGYRYRWQCLSASPGRLVPSGRIQVLEPQEGLRIFSIRFSRRLLSEVTDSYEAGKVSKKNALLAYASLHLASGLACRGLVDALVTPPVHKGAMKLVDPEFVGHTEYLARQTKSRRVAMMFDGGKLRVTLVSIHIPLKEVSARITQKEIEAKIELTHHFLRRFYGLRKPRIAVSALNPHGGEFGREEGQTISPAIRAAKRRGILASGPFPGDQIFYEAYHGKYDAVVAMYHDQGLGPLKTVAFEDAVNITLGLPFIRTSPDHGTAFDIAARNQANENSMLAALRLALKLASRWSR